MNKRKLLPPEYHDIHNDKNATHIAEIEIESVYEEKTFNDGFRIKRHGLCKISIYDNEGTIPHFHIENNDESFSCCIRLDKPEYFSHGTHDDKLSNTDIKNLINCLNKINKEFNCSKYELMCKLWNSERTRHRIKEPYVMPDYTKLND